MQVKKEEVREKILCAGKEEILKWGYDKASLRNMAKIAGINHGNIKTYFETKTDLFRELVRPATEYLDDYLADTTDYNQMSEKELRNFLAVETTKKNHISFFTHVKDQREVFYMLFFKGNNDFSTMIRDKYADQFEKISDHFLEALIEKKIIKPRKINGMFRHTVSRLFIISIEEIITNNPNQKEMEAYAEEFSKFAHYGTYGAINLLSEIKEG